MVCLPRDRLCDGFTDCLSGYDEGEFSNLQCKKLGMQRDKIINTT